MLLESNLRGLCDHYGLDYQAFLSDLNVEEPNEMSVYELTAITEEYNIDLYSFLFKPIFRPHIYKQKLKSIKLLILDVDGVLTDGGMYSSENGDQFKKYNAKDGMGILHLTKNNFQVGIISSGFKGDAVKARADLLGIQNFYLGRDNKMDILKGFCSKLNLELKEVAIIGDDINDMEIIRNIGFSACPADAVKIVKANVDVVLTKKGGEGCVREFIDEWLLDEPIEG
jgi:3-deoxy-D-manno-octulosonate 8-phosphate phosphatase (KDO 8-P phosphatase)